MLIEDADLTRSPCRKFTNMIQAIAGSIWKYVGHAYIIVLFHHSSNSS
jgi:hypothetical protein